MTNSQASNPWKEIDQAYRRCFDDSVMYFFASEAGIVEKEEAELLAKLEIRLGQVFKREFRMGFRMGWGV